VDWVDVVVTSRARAKIRQRLREMGLIEPADQEKPKPVQPSKKPVPIKTPVREVDESTRQKLIRVQGEKGLAVQFPKCCNPMPGHRVVGYVTRYTGITIHRAKCGYFARMKPDPGRVIKVWWEGEGQFEIGVRVIISPRPNILADITEAIRPLVIEMTSARFEPGKNGESDFQFVFNTTDQTSVDQVKRTIHTVAGVKGISTLFVREVAAAQ
jgi:GTP pyrophosphokinase